jgi:hypothetical protein
MLEQIRREYKEIMDADLSDYQRDKKLSMLMDKMKRQFGIPLFQDPAWEKANPEVIKLYRQISDSRTL